MTRPQIWMNRSHSVALSFGLYAPALLGLATVLVMLTWLLVLRHLEPPRMVLDQTAFGVLRLWLVLAAMASLTLLVLRLVPVKRSKPLTWRSLPLHAALLWAPALLWLYFLGGAVLVLALPPGSQSPPISPELRAQIRVALFAWLCTSLLVAITRVVRLHRASTTASGEVQ